MRGDLHVHVGIAHENAGVGRVVLVHQLAVARSVQSLVLHVSSCDMHSKCRFNEIDTKYLVKHQYTMVIKFR